ncbi:virulence RhuM family protein [Methanimicrococcus sp. OttesenSCG-928-J09]|nr:virulence RhuM family protein [Methanimicrococcus sp. OttesenSCG-928-J09]
MNKNSLQYQLYKLDDENEINALVKDETIWLTQKSMSELFGVGVPAINKHLKNIFESGELDEEVVVSILEITTDHGALPNKTQTKDAKFYSLDAIISVGYRVNSLKATRFRQWATKILREYMTKGFVLDDERLKQGEKVFGKDYFKELLERVRSIRASERRIWLQLTDIFAEISVDYDKDSPVTREFYAMVQNKFHYAITGQTAAEIINDRVDSGKENMGLTAWTNSPGGRILKSDVIVAKNYLNEKEIKKLERSVSGFFDYIEDLIEDENLLCMEDFAVSIDEFLKFRRYQILNGKGSISKQDAERKAFFEYAEFNKTQKINSDFEKEVARLKIKKDE